eukprot:15087737-Ditylum_brightwellii.AAC.1
MALHQCFSVGNGSDIIHTLPVIHMLRRDWYDDEGFVEYLEEQHNYLRGVVTLNNGPKGNNLAVSSSLPTATGGINPIIMKSLQDSVDKIKVTELQEALKKKGLKTSGSKSLLQEQLIYSLLDNEHLDGLPLKKHGCNGGV